MHYHYDTKIRKNGDKEVVFKVPCGYADLVKNIQDAMIKELVQNHIECAVFSEQSILYEGMWR